MAALSPLLASPTPMFVLLVLLLAGYGVEAASRCQDTVRQNELDLNKVTGKWYVAEIVDHDPKVTEMTSYVQPKCPIVQLHRLNATSSWLTLSWSEDIGNVMYNFNVTNVGQAPGRWRSIGKQEGSMTRQDKWQHFEGVVLVLKAVEDHVVLTFCQYDPNLHPYTVVLSRDRRMHADDIESVNKMVHHRKLYMGLIKHTCQGGAAATAPAAAALVVFAAVAQLLLGHATPS